MKIETHLSPNCSEATFQVRDSRGRFKERFSEASDNGDECNIKDFMTYCIKKLDEGCSIDVVDNQGNRFQPEILDAIKSMRAKGIVIAVPENNFHAMYDELVQSVNNSEDVIIKYTKTKVELLAEGYYGRKKK